jgi:hypothetical protein
MPRGIGPGQTNGVGAAHAAELAAAEDAERRAEIQQIVAAALAEETSADPVNGTPAHTTYDPPYAYGPPAATAPRESNYISDDGMLAWLAAKQEGLYGELRDRMDTSEARSKLIEDLTNLKTYLGSEQVSKEGMATRIAALLQAYEGTPFEAEIEELLKPPIEAAGSSIAAVEYGAVDELNISKKGRENLSQAIEGKTDALGRNDQLELIRINSLSSDINQAAQLASNLLSSSNQTANTIVGNIGR